MRGVILQGIETKIDRKDPHVTFLLLIRRQITERRAMRPFTRFRVQPIKDQRHRTNPGFGVACYLRGKGFDWTGARLCFGQRFFLFRRGSRFFRSFFCSFFCN